MGRFGRGIRRRGSTKPRSRILSACMLSLFHRRVQRSRLEVTRKFGCGMSRRVKSRQHSAGIQRVLIFSPFPQMEPRSRVKVVKRFCCGMSKPVNAEEPSWSILNSRFIVFQTRYRQMEQSLPLVSRMAPHNCGLSPTNASPSLPNIQSGSGVLPFP